MPRTSTSPSTTPSAQRDQLPVLRRHGRPRPPGPQGLGAVSASATRAARRPMCCAPAGRCVFDRARLDDLDRHGRVRAARRRSRNRRLARRTAAADGRTLGVVVGPDATRTSTATTQADLELLAFVGQHIGSALSRARRSRRPASATPSWRSSTRSARPSRSSSTSTRSSSWSGSVCARSSRHHRWRSACWTSEPDDHVAVRARRGQRIHPDRSSLARA